MARHCPPHCEHLHFSTLKWMGRSPAHFRHVRENGIEQTPAMLLGSAIHNLVLEEGSLIVKFDGAVRRGKAWEEFSALQDPDAIVLSAKESDVAEAAAQSVRSTPHAMELLSGAREQTIDWPIGGRRCRGTFDVANFGMVELKSTNDARPEFFSRLAMKMSYFSQVPWYMDGHEAAGLGTLERGFIVAVETAAPYVVQTFELTEAALLFGRKQYRLWMERVAVCEESGLWPGYQESDAPLDVAEDLELQIGGEMLEVA